MTQAECELNQRAQIDVLADLHNDIDRAVLAAYGWSDLADDLVGRPGGTTPATDKDEAQGAAEEALLSRLVALNRERAEEEAGGRVRWLRPDYQAPRLAARAEARQAEADLAPVTGTAAPAWPGAKAPLSAEITAVRDALDAAAGPVDAEALNASFKGAKTKKRAARIAELLDALVANGLARDTELGIVPR